MSATPTRHSPTCTKVFARYDLTCPRCQELAQGAPARKGWINNSAQADAQRCRAIAAHFAPGGRYSQQTEVERMCCTAFES